MKKSPRTKPLENCPICKSKNIKSMFTSTDRLHGIPGEFSYSVCDECQTVFQNPMVIAEDIPLCYPQDYYTHSSEFTSQELVNVGELLNNSANGIRGEIRKGVIKSIQGQKTDNLMEKIGGLLAKSRRLRERSFAGRVMDELLPFHPNKPKALEVGCGSGILLNKLRSVGWEVEGIEWDEKAAEIARKNTQSIIRVGNFMMLDLPSANYDLIVLHHVFEHLTDPLEALKKMKRLLKNGGKIVLVYPNAQSLGAKFYKNQWFPWETPRHLIFIPVKTLKKYAEKMSFNVSIRTSARFADYFSANSRCYQKNLIIDEYNPDKNLKDSMIMKIENFLIFTGLHVGDEAIVVLQKDN